MPLREPSDLDKVEFGPRLRHARIDRGMTQAELAQGICDTSSISYWESGRSTPDASILLQLAQRLNIDAYILTGNGFDPLTATSPENFVSLIDACLEAPSLEFSHTNDMAQWLWHARNVLYAADPWLPTRTPQQSLEFLQTSRLSVLSPGAMSTLTVLEQLTNVSLHPGTQNISALVDALTWNAGIPQHLRDHAVETAAALYLFQGMPYAAQGVITRVPLHHASVAFTELTKLAQIPLDMREKIPSDNSPHHYTPRSSRDFALKMIRVLHQTGHTQKDILTLLQEITPVDTYPSECVQLLFAGH